MTDFIEHAIEAGTHIRSVVEDMRAIAKFSGVPVLAEFNGHVLMAEPHSTFDDVIRDWDHQQQQSYFGEVIFER